MALVWRMPLREGSYTLSAEFGRPGKRWASGYHTGQDFAAATGTPIMAVAAGLVTDVKRSGAYGNQVVVTHANGIRTRYAHMSRIAVTLLEPVSAGEVIGYVGATGNTTGAHLHLEFIIGGKTVDPMLYLGKAVETPDLPSDDRDSRGGTFPDDTASVDLTSGSTWVRVGYFIGGAALLGMGGYMAVKGKIL